MSCGKTSAPPADGSKDRLQLDVKALRLGPRPVPGEIKAFLDESIDINTRCSPEPSRECCSMFLTMASARLAMMHDLVEISLQRVG